MIDDQQQQYDDIDQQDMPLGDQAIEGTNVDDEMQGQPELPGPVTGMDEMDDQATDGVDPNM